MASRQRTSIRTSFTIDLQHPKTSRLTLIHKIVPIGLDVSGKRIKRGLYRAGKGQYLNSDVNGAINIMRKELGDEVLPPLANWGCVFQPVRVSLHRQDAPKVVRTKRIITQAQFIAA